MAFLRVLEQAPEQSEVGDAFLDDPASSLKQQVAGSSFRSSDFGLQRGGSEKLASTSLDAGISVGVHRVDAYTTQASIDIDANLSFGQNSKTCRNRYAEMCTTYDIDVKIRGTGESAMGYPVYEVMVFNHCVCSQSSILLHCPGFRTTLPVDPAIFRPVGDGINCIVKDYGPIFQGEPVQFKYAWRNSFDLAVVSSHVNCS
ncbi:hypothetical protein Taro_005610 [Colocasia esculenta]|uniref:Uncharacterized protein n=1 Tax=Colocasia esculenta TaxID=4460 RepID=A0A843TTI8_COLES|nr:hypothetical protein [Colocasia esculenta]